MVDGKGAAAVMATATAEEASGEDEPAEEASEESVEKADDESAEA